MQPRYTSVAGNPPHNHSIPASGFTVVSAGNGQHMHVIDTTGVSNVVEIIPEEDICIYYSSYPNEIRRVHTKDNLYSWEKNEVLSSDQLCDLIGDMFGGMIQEGGDIKLFKAMVSERLKEVIKEFTPEDTT